ncbi:PREDICTED: uncharacterized protein LOC100631663 isoform X1 [Amphimedon queenslandica]|uniref:Uncharacterized protein n=1 Tax=Amphimedon queenslandica TaxID=400682 RepID=A0A1X7UL61_AMPQE|nr:PREDICTED: uncharacterized protein LOC100631663 isoform X1 [Amphimedon queenslandica]|eukprot:XP_011404806.1 PREDICTED: uncharacterized protein LOC100631663 isoform X1 [Amphimedon queenslandica]
MASRLYHTGIRFSAHNSFRMQTILSLNRNLRNTASRETLLAFKHFFVLLFLDAFFVRRTKTNNIPAYLDYKGGGTRTLTIVRKIDGDTEVSNGGRRVQLFDANSEQDDEDF